MQYHCDLFLAGLNFDAEVIEADFELVFPGEAPEEPVIVSRLLDPAPEEPSIDAAVRAAYAKIAYDLSQLATLAQQKSKKKFPLS